METNRGSDDEILKEVLKLMYPNSPDVLKYATQLNKEAIKKAIQLTKDKKDAEFLSFLKDLEFSDSLERNEFVYLRQTELDKIKKKITELENREAKK